MNFGESISSCLRILGELQREVESSLNNSFKNCFRIAKRAQIFIDELESIQSRAKRDHRTPQSEPSSQQINKSLIKNDYQSLNCTPQEAIAVLDLKSALLDCQSLIEDCIAMRDNKDIISPSFRNSVIVEIASIQNRFDSCAERLGVETHTNFEQIRQEDIDDYLDTITWSLEHVLLSLQSSISHNNASKELSQFRHELQHGSNEILEALIIARGHRKLTNKDIAKISEYNLFLLERIDRFESQLSASHSTVDHESVSIMLQADFSTVDDVIAYLNEVVTESKDTSQIDKTKLLASFQSCLNLISNNSALATVLGKQGCELLLTISTNFEVMRSPMLASKVYTIMAMLMRPNETGPSIAWNITKFSQFEFGELLVNAMSFYDKEPVVLESIAMCIRYFSCDDNYRKYFESKVQLNCEVLVNALKTHILIPSFVEAVIPAISNLCNSDLLLNAFLHNDICQILLSAMEIHFRHLRICLRLCDLFGTLSSLPVSILLLGYSGCIPMATKILEEHITSAEIVELVCSSLWNFTSYPDFQVDLMKSNSCRVFSKALKSHIASSYHVDIICSVMYRSSLGRFQQCALLYGFWGTPRVLIKALRRYGLEEIEDESVEATSTTSSPEKAIASEGQHNDSNDIIVDNLHTQSSTTFNQSVKSTPTAVTSAALESICQCLEMLTHHDENLNLFSETSLPEMLLSMIARCHESSRLIAMIVKVINGLIKNDELNDQMRSLGYCEVLVILWKQHGGDTEDDQNNNANNNNNVSTHRNDFESCRKAVKETMEAFASSSNEAYQELERLGYYAKDISIES